MWVTMILIIVGALNKEAKRITKWKTNRDYPNFRILDICWEEIWRLEETCREKPSANDGVKNFKKYERGLITAIRNDTDNTTDNRMTIPRKQKWEGKQLYGSFKRLINNISHDKTWTWLRKGNFKRETEYLLIAAQDNVIRTKQIKARIDKTRQNSKCRLCGDRDETFNHIISECSKLAQKDYKSRHDWVGKEIHWEMCKKFKFDHSNKWYMHKPAHVINNTHKLLWDFDIKTNHLISARRPDLIIINKKKREFVKLWTIPNDHWIKLKESEKKDKYLDPARELKKKWNVKVTIIPIVIGAFGKGTGGHGSWRMSGDHPNYSIVENGQNTEKSPGYLRRLAVTRTPKKDHQLTLMWKI